MKKCGKCKIKKEESEFNKCSKAIDGLNYWCRKCQKINNKQYYIDNKEKIIKHVKKRYKENPEKQRNRNYKRRFNITIDDYNKMFKKQNGKCDICGSNDSGSIKTEHFFIDHNHITGKIRGLLCYSCNSAVGLLKDDIEISKNLTKYLTKYLEDIKDRM